ncbi:hypothetical protein [Methylobacterium planeticum]|uniref:Uncharacterized protein n=1 Tax=Methylobacterium planeticum TaxID=2615211 RepID=A0A6N6MMS5_9HYPH|nr:hypothetical protein [Methylobacterium planeticum]KAB1072096.1 hypothetical protein F6X51_16845 [Methylobacterium planeticum]
MTSSRSGRRAPVVLSQKQAARRRRGREGALGAEALDAPLPGPLLVLLSRLHRAEHARPEGRPGEAPSRDEDLGGERAVPR